MQYRVLRELQKAGARIAVGTVVADPRWCNLPSLLVQGIVVREAGLPAAKPLTVTEVGHHAGPAHKDVAHPKAKKKEPGT